MIGKGKCELDMQRHYTNMSADDMVDAKAHAKAKFKYREQDS